MKQLLLLPLLLCFSAASWSHGYVESPASRAFACKQQKNTNCGSVQYEPQSVEGPKGFPERGPKDGQLASAGRTPFFPLDVQNTSRWSRNVIDNAKIDFQWFLTAVHKTTKWEYFITKTGWDANQPLARSQFELTPFCEFHKVEIPAQRVVHSCTLPSDKKGYHVILAVWTIDDTSNAFYQAIDAEIN